MDDPHVPETASTSRPEPYVWVTVLQLTCMLAAVVCVFGGFVIASQPDQSNIWAGGGILAGLVWVVLRGVLILLREIADAVGAGKRTTPLRSPFDPPPKP